MIKFKDMSISTVEMHNLPTIMSENGRYIIAWIMPDIIEVNGRDEFGLCEYFFFRDEKLVSRTRMHRVMTGAVSSTGHHAIVDDVSRMALDPTKPPVSVVHIFDSSGTLLHQVRFRACVQRPEFTPDGKVVIQPMPIFKRPRVLRL